MQHQLFQTHLRLKSSLHKLLNIASKYSLHSRITYPKLKSTASLGFMPGSFNHAFWNTHLEYPSEKFPPWWNVYRCLCCSHPETCILPMGLRVCLALPWQGAGCKLCGGQLWLILLLLWFYFSSLISSFLILFQLWQNLARWRVMAMPTSDPLTLPSVMLPLCWLSTGRQGLPLQAV